MTDIGYCPINGRTWKHEIITIEPIHIVEKYNLLWKLSTDKDINDYQVGISLSNGDLIKAPVEYFNKLVLPDKMLVMGFHTPYIITRELNIVGVVLISPKNKKIVGVKYSVRIKKDNFFRADYYFYFE